MKLNQLKIPVTIKISFHFTAVMPPLKTHDAFWFTFTMLPSLGSRNGVRVIHTGVFVSHTQAKVGSHTEAFSLMNPQPPWTHTTLCYRVVGGGGVGWGGAITCMFACKHTHWAGVGLWLGGVGWDGVITFSFACKHTHWAGVGSPLLCSLSPWQCVSCSVLPSGLPESGKTDLPMWCLSRVLRLGCSAAQILQNGPLHRAPMKNTMKGWSKYAT